MGSLIRLTEARAKLELRQVVTENDALDVIEIMKASIYDVCCDDVGRVDFQRSKGCSMPTLQKDFKNLMWKLCKARRTNRFKAFDLKQVLRNNNFPGKKIEKLLEVLERHTVLKYQTSTGEYVYDAGAEFNVGTPNGY